MSFGKCRSRWHLGPKKLSWNAESLAFAIVFLDSYVLWSRLPINHHLQVSALGVTFRSPHNRIHLYLWVQLTSQNFTLLSSLPFPHSFLHQSLLMNFPPQDQILLLNPSFRPTNSSVYQWSRRKAGPSLRQQPETQSIDCKCPQRTLVTCQYGIHLARSAAPSSYKKPFHSIGLLLCLFWHSRKHHSWPLTRIGRALILTQLRFCYE